VIDSLKEALNVIPTSGFQLGEPALSIKPAGGVLSQKRLFAVLSGKYPLKSRFY